MRDKVGQVLNWKYLPSVCLVRLKKNRW